MDRITQELNERLKRTFKVYICHAIEHAISEEESENDILQTIINVQASLELLSKLYVLQFKGWRGIVDPKFHNKTEAELLSDIEKGMIKTTQYSKNKEFISKEIILDDTDMSLLDNFQNYRNQVMHLGVTTPSRDILNEAIWVIVRIIHQLRWQDTLPMSDQYMANSLKSLLGNTLYNNLINCSCYVGEAVDRAYTLYPDDIKLCIECGHESWVLDANEDRICLVCGYRSNNDVFGFIDCPACRAEGQLIYDAYNIEFNECLDGKCSACKKISPVFQCSECENVFPYPGDCTFCKN